MSEKKARGRLGFLLGLLAALLVLGAGGLPAAASGAGWQHKVEPRVLAAAEQGSTDLFVILAEQAELSGARVVTWEGSEGALCL